MSDAQRILAGTITTTMHALNRLALLSTTSIDYRRVRGGEPILTPEMVAAALGMIHHHEAALLGRIVYAGQLDYQSEFERKALSVIAGQARGWKLKRPGIIRDMIRLAIEEMRELKACPACNGTPPAVFMDGKLVICGTCDGTRVEARSSYWRYKRVGVHQEEWRRNTGYQYDMIYRVVNEWRTILEERLPQVLRY